MTFDPVLQNEVVHEPVFYDAPPTGPRDYVALIEAAYDFTQDEGDWLLRVLRAAIPILNCGRGVSGWFWDLSQDGKAVVSHPTYVGCSRQLFEAHRASGASTTVAQAERLFVAGPPTKVISAGAIRIYGEAGAKYQQHAAPGGFVHVSCADFSRKGCVINAPFGGAARLPPEVRRGLNQVARHIVAANRLRRAVASVQSTDIDSADAVFDPEGRLLHAEPHAESPRERSGLIGGVRRLLDSRRVRRSQPEDAVALWRALVLGRWSLVDHQDSDGKRFLLARKNAPDVTEPTALNEQERRAAALFALLGTIKLVAYELGLATSTVSEQIKRATRKLGCRDRADLARVLSPPRMVSNDG